MNPYMQGMVQIFPINLLKQFGLYESSVLIYLSHNVRENKKLGINSFEDRTWVQKSVRKMLIDLPHLKKDPIIYNALHRLIAKGIVIKKMHHFDNKLGEISYCFRDQDYWI